MQIELTDYQRCIIDDTRAFARVICAMGRMSGKSTTGASAGLEWAVGGEKVVSINPSRSASDRFKNLVSLLDKNIERSVYGPRHAVVGKGIIHFTSPSHGGLKGYSGNLVIVNDAGVMSRDVWPEIAPMLIFGGHLLVLGTPRYDKDGVDNSLLRFLWDHSGGRDDTKRNQVPSSASPCVTQEAIDSLLVDLGAARFRCQIDADFMSQGD